MSSLIVRAVLTLAALAHLCVCGVPLVRALAPGLPFADAVVLGPGLAVSLFTWVCAWSGLLPGQPLAGWAPLAVWALFAAAGHVAHRRTGGGLVAWMRERSFTREPSAWVAGFLLVAFCGGMALVNVYLPASHWDFLGRYGMHARILFETGRLDASVNGYPPFAAVFAAAVYAGCGAVVEELGKLHGPLFAALTLALVWRMAGHPRRPWLARGAVLLVGLSPAFLNSIPSGDPDLALTFHATACVYALVADHPAPPGRLALLAGLHLGMALWAKQAAAPFVVSLVLLAVVPGLGVARPRITVALGVALAAVAPWYLRNVAVAGVLAPLANANDGAFADRSLASLVAPIRWWSELGAPGAPFLALGLVAIAVRGTSPGALRVPARAVAAVCGLGALAMSGAVAARGRGLPPFDVDAIAGGALAALGLALAGGALGVNGRGSIPLVWVAPMLGVWWVKFSFAARYLLPVLPPLAVIGARVGYGALAPFFRASPSAWALALPLVALLTAETYPLWQVTLARIAEDPLRDRAARWALYCGPLERTGARLRAAHARRVASNDGRLAYFLDLDARVADIPAGPGDLRDIEWVVIAPYGDSMFTSPAEVRARVERMRAVVAPRTPVLADGGYEVYRIGGP